jgi:mannosyltransferase
MPSAPTLGAAPPRSAPVTERPPAGPAAGRPRAYTAWLAILPALAALAVGLTGAAEREMWNNEYATWHAATLSTADLRLLLVNTDLVHTVYLLFIKGWIHLFGDTPLVLRLPSVIGMSLAAGATALLGRRLVGTPAGVVAGLILALIPSVSRYAQEARSYAIVTMAVAAITLLLLRALDRPGRLGWGLYASGVLATGLLHFVSLTVLAAHLLFVLRTTSRDDARRYQWAGSVGVAGLGIIPLLSFASRQSASISWIKADNDAIRMFPEELFLSWRAAGLVLGLAALGILVCWRGGRHALPMLGTWALLPPLFVYLTYPVLHLFLARYVLFTLPAWALLAATAVCGVARIFPARARSWAWIIPATLALPGFAYAVEPDHRGVRASPVAGQPDYRAAIDTVRRDARPGDGLIYNDVFGKQSDLAREAVDYEMRDDDRPRDVFLAVTSVDRGSYSAAECTDPAPCLGQTARVWLISTTYSVNALDGLDPARVTLLHDYRVISDQRYQGVRLQLLARPGSAGGAADQ